MILGKLTGTWLAVAAAAFCQTPLALRNVVKVAPVSTVIARAGKPVEVALPVQVDPGFHVNSDKPADEYLIPLRLTWNPGPLEKPVIAFPKPQTAKLPFSAKPVSIFTGSFDIVTRFKVARDASPGPGTLAGKLHYQACDDRECLTPKTIDVMVPVEIVR